MYKSFLLNTGYTNEQTLGYLAVTHEIGFATPLEAMLDFKKHLETASLNKYLTNSFLKLLTYTFGDLFENEDLLVFEENG